MSLQDVPPQHAFWLAGGKAIKNVRELAKALKIMNAETFNHHVNAAKNDFANWVEHCVKDRQLATLMRTTREQGRTTSIIERRIQELTKPVKKIPQPKEEPLPSIIRTKNVTQLAFVHKSPVITTRNVTPLNLSPEERKIIRTGKTTTLAVSEPRRIVNTPNKTHLKLNHEHPQREIYVHEVKKRHQSAATLISYVILGVVMGVAIVVLSLAFT